MLVFSECVRDGLHIYRNHLLYMEMLFKCQPSKLVKYTQTIRRQIDDELFECVQAFCWPGA